MAEAPDTVVGIVFKREVDEGADFEAVFSAILSTVVLASLPVGEQAVYLKVGAILLSVFTLFRWMAVKGRFADEMHVLSSSIRFVEFLSIVCLFHVVYTVIGVLPVSFGLSPLVAASTASIFVTIASVVVFELVLRNYRIWWGPVFFVRAAATKREAEATTNTVRFVVLSLLSFIWVLTAYFTLRDTIPNEDEDAWNDLREFVHNVEDSLGKNSQEISGYVAFVVSGIIVLPILAALAFVLSLVLGSFMEVFLLLLGIRGLKHVIGFLSLAYGTATLEMHLQTNGRAILTHTLYTGSIYYLFELVPLSTELTNI